MLLNKFTFFNTLSSERFDKAEQNDFHFRILYFINRKCKSFSRCKDVEN